VVVSYRAHVGEAEHHEQALVQIVRLLHGVLERVVLLGTLGGLHPVKDVVSFTSASFRICTRSLYIFRVAIRYPPPEFSPGRKSR
jgi:hypothetical protein